MTSDFVIPYGPMAGKKASECSPYFLLNMTKRKTKDPEFQKWLDDNKAAIEARAEAEAKGPAKATPPTSSAK